MIGISKKMWLRFARAESGVSAVEFALIVPVLCIMTIGMVDFSMWVWNQLRVGNAARAGAEYAVIAGYDSAKISTVITGATGMAGISANPAPVQACGCPNVTSGITAASCGSTCAGGATPGTYVTSYAQAGYSLIFPWPGVASPVVLTARYTVRIN